ncbi:MAG: Flp pilus assembly protein CpaB [Planctomycetaceae bacterium]|nr:Flp pilus assembly protein CpaB [Planctomycetaceae bacterium]
MRAKSLILIFIALGCGLVASIGISQIMEKDVATANVIETVDVYVARTDLDINTRLSAENVQLEQWPKGKTPTGVVSQLEQLEDKYSLHRMYAGEPILVRKLSDQATGPSHTIPPGYRVTTVRVQVDEAGGGLAKPGDRVDIIAFLRKGRDVPVTMTKTILRNVRVFAVNDQTERSLDDTGRSVTVKTLSLLVKRDQVETLTLATELGRLRMSLRRPGDELDDESAAADSDVTSLVSWLPQLADDVSPPAPQATSSVRNPFLGFLDDLERSKSDVKTGAAVDPNPVQQPVVEDPFVHRMVVITNRGNVTYGWKNGAVAPQMLNGNEVNGPLVPPGEQVAPFVDREPTGGSTVDREDERLLAAPAPLEGE